MQDIAGCRVIFRDQHAVRRLQARIHHNNWNVQKVFDYVASPKSDGYRAVHVIVLRDNRLVEVQLRTTWQHEWARSVEALDLIHGHGLKEGRGPEVLRELLERSAYAVETTGNGGTMPPEFDADFQRLRLEASQYLLRRR
jgi:ppGpp synthetase/RelA/SpoT-type nucleotidyltranferase